MLSNISAIETLLFEKIETVLKVKSATFAALRRLKICYVRDLLFHLPIRYVVKRSFPSLDTIQPKEHVILKVKIIGKEVKYSKAKQILKFNAISNGDKVALYFFHIPPAFILHFLSVGNTVIVEGKVECSNNIIYIIHPEIIFNTSQLSHIEPVYPLTYGLNNKQLHNYISKVFNLLPEVKHVYPINNAAFLKIGFTEALKNIHFPTNFKDILPSFRRLSYEELLSNQYSLVRIKKYNDWSNRPPFTKALELQQLVLQNLGFTLTPSQEKVIHEIEADQLSNQTMLRILQGDVGSGKTLVALLTILNVIQSKLYQAAIMAPTDLLAVQHFELFSSALKSTNLKIALLTGKMPAKKHRELLNKIAQGEIDLLVGTHALFQDKVVFKQLAYVVIDEQHKFGVKQRLKLIEKAKSVDLLMMTATPIPRSMILSTFGELSVSKMFSKPKNQLPVITKLMPKDRLNQLLVLIKNSLQSNKKIYWICPAIEQRLEESDEIRTCLMDVETRFNSLNNLYSGQVSLLHGKMPGLHKNQIMQQFKEQDRGILVSTTVIEVGIDIPEANLIIIENAEIFGLSQLHQLRGRVGRNNIQSHCVLLHEEKLNYQAIKRLEVVRDNFDGFAIAEHDLGLRGGGDILGVKQSGENEFLFAKLERDQDLLLEANKVIKTILDSDTLDIELESRLTFLVRLFNRENIEFLKA